MTSKELSFIEDIVKNEQTLAKKYQTYASMVQDPTLAQTLTKTSEKHEQHCKALINNLKV